MSKLPVDVKRQIKEIYQMASDINANATEPSISVSEMRNLCIGNSRVIVEQCARLLGIPKADSPDVCLYHDNCVDGFAAAWIVKQFYPDVKLIAVSYSEPVPEGIAGMSVVIVDFSYPLEVMTKMITKSDADCVKSLLVLDHHKTAGATFDELAKTNLSELISYLHLYEPTVWCDKASESFAPFKYIFDIDHSGAMMTWKYFITSNRDKVFSDEAPKIVEYIEDRDLWLFKLLDSRYINTYIQSLPLDLVVYDELMGNSSKAELNMLAQFGNLLMQAKNNLIDRIIIDTFRYINIQGTRVPVCNAPHPLSSEVCERLLHSGYVSHYPQAKLKFAASYYDTADCRVFSLRSLEDGADVASIAANMGGGGHVHAAGFKTKLDWFGDE